MQIWLLLLLVYLLSLSLLQHLYTTMKENGNLMINLEVSDSGVFLEFSSILILKMRKTMKNLGQAVISRNRNRCASEATTI
jgi:hypothetical protein